MTRATAARLAEGWRPKVDPDWLVGWEVRPFELEEGSTEVLVAGRGPAVLLLPGLPGYKEMWLPVARALAPRFRVVTWDLRPGRAEEGWERPLRDLERISDALAPGPIAVIGHSLGGALAQRWAARRPDRVRALVLSSSFAKVGGWRGNFRKRVVEQIAVLVTQRVLPESLAAATARRFAARGAWVYDDRCGERTLAFVRHCIRTLPPALARDCLRLAFAHDTRADLASLPVPALVLVGERESAWAHVAARELAGSIPGAVLRVSPGVGHLHPLSSPGWLAATAADWIA